MWNLYEQIVIAALDNGDSTLANECIIILLKKFPESSRVRRLLGLRKELVEDYKGALEIYAGLLTKNPSNLMVMKRKVCICMYNERKKCWNVGMCKCKKFADSLRILLKLRKYICFTGMCAQSHGGREGSSGRDQ